MNRYAIAQFHSSTWGRSADGRSRAPARGGGAPPRGHGGGPDWVPDATGGVPGPRLPVWTRVVVTLPPEYTFTVVPTTEVCTAEVGTINESRIVATWIVTVAPAPS